MVTNCVLRLRLRVTVNENSVHKTDDLQYLPKWQFWRQLSPKFSSLHDIFNTFIPFFFYTFIPILMQLCTVFLSNYVVLFCTKGTLFPAMLNEVSANGKQIDCKTPKNSETPNIAVIALKFKVALLLINASKKCRQNGKQCWPWSGAVWSGSTLFAQTCLSKNLGILRYSTLNHGTVRCSVILEM